MTILRLRRLTLLATFTVMAGGQASAQDRIPADPDPTRLANAPENQAPRSDWQFQIGVGTIYGPAFLGSDDYQLRAGPNVEIRYKDRFFLSVIDGAGFDLIKTATFRAGPVIKYQQQRRENGNSTFRIAGSRTDALRGLGDVPDTAEAGGYLQYQAGAFSAKAEVRQGIGGHDGLIADLGARYTTRFTAPPTGERPVIFSIGPRATIVDDKYNQAYFGVTPEQSTRSGLARYNAGGGLLSYGVGAAFLVPVSGRLNAALLGGYDRLAGDAADSPLVQERGSRNQATVGLGLIYRFGL